jgi:uncharacterized protein (TIGR03437 family)
MRQYRDNAPSTRRLRRHFGTALWPFATALLAIAPCVAQLPPGIVYSTNVPYLGTTPFPTVSAVVTDASGNSYVAGSVYSDGLASTPGVVQPQFAGGTCPVGLGTGACADAFIAKLNSNGTLVFFTYLGGTGDDVPNALVVDTAGDIYVGGTTSSTNFPLAGAPWRPTLSTNLNSFVAKLSGEGTTLIWSTVVNGGPIYLALAPDTSLYLLSQGDAVSALTKLTSTGQLVTTVSVPSGAGPLAIGADGSVYIGGSTAGASLTDVPDVTATPGAWQTTYGGGPSDGFVAKMNPNLSGFAWLTYVGGNGADFVSLMQLAPDGSLWVSGSTSSSNFPVPAGAFQTQLSAGGASGFLVHLSGDGSKALASTYIPTELTSMALDGSGNVVVSTFSPTSFQATPGAEWPCRQAAPAVLEQITSSGGIDIEQLGFFGKIDAAGQHLLWGTWTGPSVPFGPATVDKNGNAVAVGNVPGPQNAAQGDITLTAMTTTPGPPRLVESCIAQSAYPYTAGPLAAGEIFSIYGAGFGPQQGVAAQPQGNKIGSELGGVQVLVESTPAPLLYVSSTQINLVAPFLLDGRTAAHIQVVTADATSNEVVLGVQQAVPEIFESQPNVAAILNQDGTLNGPNHPAHIGDTVALFISGAGQTTPAGVDGEIAQAAGGTPVLAIKVQLNVPGMPFADVTFAGNAPGLVSGQIQVKFRIPQTNYATTSEYSVQLVLYVGGTSVGGPFGPTVWIQ